MSQMLQNMARSVVSNLSVEKDGETYRVFATVKDEDLGGVWEPRLLCEITEKSLVEADHLLGMMSLVCEDTVSLVEDVLGVGNAQAMRVMSTLVAAALSDHLNLDCMVNFKRFCDLKKEDFFMTYCPVGQYAEPSSSSLGEVQISIIEDYYHEAIEVEQMSILFDYTTLKFKLKPFEDKSL